ncbi:hypothetical protein [Streptomyces griseus]|uniref:hypothetical protein n=1 Tax=Streptomyces griseus TaxID=1911 RepID=UPI0004C78564|nr:hypothetical protein [Streptomyces griseus]
MSTTTRHHLNRQRRRQTLAQGRTPVAPGEAGPAPRRERRTAADPVREDREEREDREDREEQENREEQEERDAPAARGARRPRVPLLVVLCALTLLFGGFAGWAAHRAGELRDDPVRANTALTDPARTSEVKGRTAAAVAALFSYDHTDPGAFERARKTLLTGKAVEQHRALFAGVLAGAAAQKPVITTTVTDSAVERIDGDRARVLVYADQTSVSTAGPAPGGKPAKGGTPARDQGVYAGAMFAVDVVRRGDVWLVEGIDTFGR